MIHAAGNDEFTKLYIPTNTPHGSTTLKDHSSSNHTLTCTGSAQADASVMKFGSPTILLGAAGNTVTAPDSADWDFGTGNFVLDHQLLFTTVPSGTPDSLFENVAIFQGLGSTRWICGFDHSDVVFNAQVAGTNVAGYKATHGMSNGVMYHFAWVRSGTSFFIFKDGVAFSLTTLTAIGSNAMPNVATDPLTVGGTGLAGPTRMGHVRVSKGTDRGWTSNFTPPWNSWG